MNAPPLFAEHVGLWHRALTELWHRRHPIVAVTILLWVPWRINLPIIDQWTEFAGRFGFPLELVADALFEPFFAGVVLTILSDSGASWGNALSKGLRLYPRLLLIDAKVAVIGIAAPLLTLYLGTATLLFVWESRLAGVTLVALTLVAFVWTFYVMLRYLLAHAVLVAEGPGTSTGWSLWASGALIRGNVLQALLVLVAGQLVVGAVSALVPPVDHVVVRVLDGCLMIASAVWWSLVWQFCLWALDRHARVADGS